MAAIAAASLTLHVGLFFALDSPRVAMPLPETAHAATTTAAGVGGTYRVDVNCSVSAAVRAAVGLALCRVWPLGNEGECADGVRREWRISEVACRAVEEIPLAKLEPTELVDADALDVEMLPLEALTAMLEREPPPEKDEPDLDGQVVDIPEPAVERAPDDAELLAEHDMAVERETIKHGEPDEALAGPTPPQPPETMPAPPQPASAEPSPSSDPPGGGALAMRAPAPPPAEQAEQRGADEGELERADQGVGLAMAAMRMSQDRPALNRPAGLTGPTGPTGPEGAPGTGTGPRLSDLRPTAQIIEQATGGSLDHVTGIDEGEFTALNARRWKYAAFFNRLKHQVAQNWHPEAVYRLRDPTGNIYGSKDRLTVLRVSLNRDGSLYKVVIAQPSGVDFLDDEAVSAFRLAAPFPNPPVALVDDDSPYITFQFGFSFEIDSPTPWKVFRYK